MPAARYAIQFTLDPKGFFFETGRAFRGFTVSQTDDGWNAIIRSRSGGGIPQYAMTRAEDPVTAFEMLWSLLLQKKGDKMWHYDKFA